MVYNFIKKKSKKLILQQIYPLTEIKPLRKFTSLTYLGKPSLLIAKFLKSQNFHVSFRNNFTIHKLLVNNKIVTKNNLSRSGIYKIKCNDCNFVYIGQTGRNFKIRFKEHINSLKTGSPKSNVAKHILNFNHECSLNNLSILHFGIKGHHLNFLEAFEIKNAVKSNIPLMNEYTDIYCSPILSMVVDCVSQNSVI